MLLSEKFLGIIILALWSLAGIIFLTAPGSVRFQKPRGGILVWLYNLIHLIYEIFLIPSTGLLLLTENLAFLKATQFFPAPQLLLTLKFTGLLLLLTGVSLFCWARIILKRSFRLACVAPHREDVLITEGPYRFVRNPMYTSVLVNCIGFTLLVQSYVFALLFLFFLIVLVFNIIPTEEKYLETAYGRPYFAYKKKAQRLFPMIY